MGAAGSGQAKIVTRRILVVDDSRIFRHVQQGLLASAAIEFLHADNGAQAIEMAVKHQPDLVLLDVQMPVMDGVKALGILKRQDSTRHIPVLIVSSSVDSRDCRTLREMGAVDCIAKPLRRESFLAHVERALAG
jgi:CheY-like chemotaxis protein